jgi:hypothetical protein
MEIIVIHLCRVLILLPILCFATLWYVHPDSSLNSIQTALDLCGDNDTVLVGPGTYNEYIIWPQTQGIDLYSWLGPDSTVIDAYGLYVDEVIFIDSLPDTATVISGFTIAHGRYGIFLDHSSPLIEHNKICDNEHPSMVAAEAAGVFCYYSNPVIQYNAILHNGAAGEIGRCGGVYCVSSSPIIRNNTIAENYSIGGITGTGSGGGIFCTTNSSPQIFGNQIYHNSAENGGGILIGAGCSVVIRKNTIFSNAMEFRGGGILCLGTVLIDSNTISANNGCGIHCATNGDVRINYNDIILNMSYAVLNETTDFVSAEYNWWGDSTGPYHPNSNPGGLGDTVSDYVDFIPWLYWPGVQDRSSIVSVTSGNTITTTIFTGPFRLPDDIACKIFDITGRQIHTLDPAPGIYFIQIDDKIVRKVIKVK